MRILLTRPEAQSAALAGKLAARGWRVDLCPLLAPEPVEAPPPETSPSALVVTSANGVRFASALDPSLPVYAVGEATAAAARAAGFADVRSADGDSRDLAALIARDRPVGSLLHLSGQETRPELADALADSGIPLERRVVYRMAAAPRLSEQVVERLGSGDIDAAAFYSPRTAEIFAALLPAAARSGLARAHAISISEKTALPLQALGFASIICAGAPTTRGMCEALSEAERLVAAAR